MSQASKTTYSSYIGMTSGSAPADDVAMYSDSSRNGAIVFKPAPAANAANKGVIVDGAFHVTGALTVVGDLTVQGTTTTVESTTVAIADKNFELAKDATTDGAADGGGLTLKGATDKTFNWVNSTDAWTSSEHMDLASGKAFHINGAKILDATSLHDNVKVSNANLSAVDTGNLTEGSNLYYTTARWDTKMAAADTGDLTEGSNLYHTTARARAAVSADADILDYDSGSGAMSVVAAALTASARVSISDNHEVLSYDNSTGQMTIAASAFTASARQSVSATDAGGDGSFAYDSDTGVFTYTGPSASEVRAHLSDDHEVLSYDNSTGAMTVVASAFTASARSTVSVTDAGGDGSMSYNKANGVLTYTGPSASEVRAHFTVTDTNSMDLTLSNGDIQADAKVDDSSIEVDASNGLQVKASGITNAMLNGSILASKMNNAIFEDLETLGAPTADGEFLVATGAGAFAYETGDTARTSLGLGESNSPQFTGLTLTGDLTVNGTTTAVNSTIVEIDDKAMVFASGSSKAAIAAAGGAGINIAGDEADRHASFLYDGDDSWDLSDNLNLASGKALNIADTTLLDADGAVKVQSGVAGDGLGHSNGVLSVNLDDSSLETDSDTLRVKALGITNAMLAGSIANAKLSNSAVTVTAGDGLSGGGSVSLGGTVSLAVGVDDSSIEIDSDSLRVKASGITNDMLAGSIANAKLSNSTVSFGGVSLALGASDATPAFNLADATNLPAASIVGGTFANSTWSFASSTISDLGQVTTANIDGGTLDGVDIGGSNQSFGKFTSISGSSALSVAGGADIQGEVRCADAFDVKASATLSGSFRLKPADKSYSAFDYNPDWSQITFGSGHLTRFNSDIMLASWATQEVTGTLDVAAGTLILANDQISGDAINGGTIGSVTISQLAGAMDANSQNITNVNTFEVDGAATFNGAVTLGDAAEDTITLNGTLTATTAITATEFVATSDARLKSDIQVVDNAIDAINSIQGVEYDLDITGEHSMGVLAQDLMEVAPSLVKTDKNGMYAVNYSGLSALFVEAIKEQQVQIEDLKNTVKELSK